jgi:hypothetical protein
MTGQSSVRVSPPITGIVCVVISVSGVGGLQMSTINEALRDPAGFFAMHCQLPESLGRESWIVKTVPKVVVEILPPVDIFSPLWNHDISGIGYASMSQ